MGEYDVAGLFFESPSCTMLHGGLSCIYGPDTGPGPVTGAVFGHVHRARARARCLFSPLNSEPEHSARARAR